MRRLAVPSFATFLLILAPPALFAQEKGRAGGDSLPLVHVAPIVVTANRAPTPAARAASSVTTISADEIERRQLPSVLEALRGVPGVAIVQSGGVGGVTSAFLRGAGADHALVLVDGVEVNDAGSPNNAADLAHLLTTDVERIEIVRGPQSTLYGSSAMGGVIQIFTRAAGGDTRGIVSAEGGSLGAAHVAASVSGGTGAWSYAATAASRRTDGISAAPAELGNTERDDHRSTAASVRLEWRGARLETGLAVRGLDASGGIDLGSPTGDDPNTDAEALDVSGRAWVGVGAYGARWRQTLAVAFARIERETVDDPDPAHPADRSRATSEGTRRALQWHHEIAALGRLVAGAEVEEERATSAFSSDGAFGPFASSFPEERARTVSAFMHHETVRGPIALGLGARVDDHDRFGTHATFRVTPVVTLPGGTRLKATFGTGFKAPTLFQLFDPDFGNPDLEPETSRGWDAGVEHDFGDGRLRVGATAFGTRFADLVGFEFPDGYRNVSAARAHGLETFASLLAGPGARVRASHTWTDTEDASEESPDQGLPLLRRPRHQAAVGLELVPSPRADLAIDVRLVGERDDKDFTAFPATRITLDGYATVRVAASFALSDALRLHARIENALDAGYREVFGYGTQGRAFYAGVRAAF